MLLTMHHICKSFPGVRALEDVDFELASGEVHALLGENGAGKSTLIKILAGAHLPDAGTLRMHGEDPHIRSPIDALRAGIGVIYQEFNLVPALSASDNVFLGQEQTRAGFMNLRRERRRAAELFQQVGVDFDVRLPCRQLSIAQQQIVEIVKSLALEARLIVMDEPTATLTRQEVDRLFELIAELKTRGIGIIYISHRLEEVFEIADRVTVLRDGGRVATCHVGTVDRQRLIEMMVGRELRDEFPARDVEPGEPRLSVSGLSRGKDVQDVSFEIRRGEVLGMTGLVGAGRTEMARLVFGADRRGEGEIRLDGKLLTIRNPRDAIAAGICLLTEDRKSQGLVLGHSVLDNFGLPNLSRFSRAGFVDRRRESKSFAGYCESLKIKVAHPRQAAGNLSGGNQQKVVLAKWLARNCEVVIFDEPTRGIDVGGKVEIYRLINELAAAGKAILMISSELPEILGMSDRILVMHEGRVTGQITDVATATQAEIMDLAVA